MNARNGMTLLEMVLAISLLSAVFLASAFWIRESAEAHARSAAPLAWEASAEALLREIHDDLVTGDANRTSEGSRVEARGGRLRIRTRSRGETRGEVLREYVFDASREEIRSIAAPKEATVLLQGVHGFSCSVDEELHQLLVRIESDAGREIERRFRLP